MNNSGNSATNGNGYHADNILETEEHMTASGRIQLTSCIARIESALSNKSLFPAERKIAEYVLKNPEEVTTFSVNELARVADASEATIVRFCRALAFTG